MMIEEFQKTNLKNNIENNIENDSNNITIINAE